MSDQEFPREMPSNIEAEQALLGAVLVNNDAFQVVMGFLKPEHFFEPFHGKLWKLISSQIGSGKQANPVTLKSFLPAEDKIGELTVMEYMAALAAGAVTVINSRDYGLAIVDMWERRKLISIGDDMVEKAFSPDPDVPAISIASAKETELAALKSDSPKEQQSGNIRATVDYMKTRHTSKVKKPTVPLPLPQISEILNGDMEAGNLYGLLSSSGEGKTSLVMQIIDFASTRNHPTLFLSYDQSAVQCIDQIVSQRTGIDANRIRAGNMQEAQWEKYHKNLDDIAKNPLVIRKCSQREDGTAQIAGYVRQFMKTHRGGDYGVPLVCLDHVRKIKPKRENDHEGRIAAEANGVCKDLADEFQLVWFNLNQRNTFGMRRKNPRPIASDVFGGEQGIEDYDGFLYLYRAHKYWKMQLATADDEKDAERVDARFQREKWQEDEAEIGAMKVRFGDPSRLFRLRFEAEYTRYVSKRDEPVPSMFEDTL
ncbi:replicative DNA helicase [Phyllobacterium sp. 22229]|uniref:replicative DNA helicase n=1 Tax=Phyllobacterium sp. 22229 TaxID=3453895 RepID=UPI003F824E05